VRRRIGYLGGMAPSGEAAESGTAIVHKGEPSATDMAQLRRRLTSEQKETLQSIVSRSIRRGFGPAAEGDDDA